jgi:hypothetical protein
MASGELVPSVPFVVLRADNKLVVPLLTMYAKMCEDNGCDAAQLARVRRLIGDFVRWQSKNPDRMGLPGRRKQAVSP